ncbi:hypothetical protein REPUB_Repub06bG0201800 [Reevesia pubescens]
MKELIGSPGTVSGLTLRITQCAFAAASIAVMVSAPAFSTYTAFCYLIASMGLQLLWSFGLACLDVYALRRKRDLQNPVLVSLFVVGDWVCNFSLRILSNLLQSLNGCMDIDVNQAFDHKLPCYLRYLSYFRLRLCYHWQLHVHQQGL